MTLVSTDRAVAQRLFLASEVALRAGAIQRERYETALSITSKSASIDLVTEVDRACEAHLVSEIERERPRDAFLA